MEAMSLRDVLAIPDEPLARFPVRNSEPRVQMGGHKWHLIYERDGGVCWICGTPVPKGSHHVDHLIPRSSYEPGDLALADRSDNLAVACPPCNEAKSNWNQPEPRTVAGVTARCWSCSVSRGIEGDEFPDDVVQVAMTVPAFCGVCGYSSVPDFSWIL